MSKFFEFDPEKALNVILWVAKRLPYPGYFQISKVVYFADLIHLQRYGRQICGDDYAALPNGPVPDGIYNMMKAPKGTDGFQFSDLVKDSFDIEEDHVVVPRRDAALEFLSESDLECLAESIRKYGKKSFNELKLLSHDKAWEEAWEELQSGQRRDNIINISSIIKMLVDGEELLDYLEDSNPRAALK
jgi:uncharacterized phage-associated protein